MASGQCKKEWNNIYRAQVGIVWKTAYSVTTFWWCDPALEINGLIVEYRVKIKFLKGLLSSHSVICTKGTWLVEWIKEEAWSTKFSTAQGLLLYFFLFLCTSIPGTVDMFSIETFSQDSNWFRHNCKDLLAIDIKLKFLDIDKIDLLTDMHHTMEQGWTSRWLFLRQKCVFSSISD